MEEGSLAVLVDAKTEYTQQFIHIIKPSVYKTVHKLFIKSKESTYVLKKFQEELSQIPIWNQDIIDKEYNNIVSVSNCDWLDELITAVFVSHTRILTSINMNKDKGKLNLKIPKTSHFIHKCYIDVARNIWKNSFLFDDRVSNKDKQKNRRECDKIIEKSIIETIRKELPLKDILKEYLGNDYINNTVNPIRTSIINKLSNYSDEKLTEIKTLLETEPKEEPKEETKEEPKKETKEEPKEEPKEETKEEPKEETKEEPKEETKEEPKEEPSVVVDSLEDVLQIEELNLDDFGNYEEVYDEPFEVKSEEPTESDIKTISITDTNNNKKITEIVNLSDVVVNKESTKEEVLEKYKNKSDIKFF